MSFSSILRLIRQLSPTVFSCRLLRHRDDAALCLFSAFTFTTAFEECALLIDAARLMLLLRAYSARSVRERARQVEDDAAAFRAADEPLPSLDTIWIDILSPLLILLPCR